MIEEIKQKVVEATGIPMEQITSDIRDEDCVFARFILVHELNSIGVPIVTISRIVNRDRTTMYNTLKKYEDNYTTNPYFRHIADIVKKKG